MKRGRFSEEKIVGILKEHEAGRRIAELARERSQRGDTVRLEEQVRRDGGWGNATTEKSGR